MAGSWSPFVDPGTGDWTVVDGVQGRCSRALAKVISATCVERGSIPGLESWGIDLSLVTHLSARTPRQIEAELDRILRPLVGLDILRFTRSAWMDDAGTLYYQISIVGPDGAPETATVQATS